VKVEIEISDDAIRSAVELDVARAITSRANGWGIQDVIKKEVEARWQAVVPKLIEQRLSNSERLNELIDEEVKRQIKSRIAKLVKAAEAK
jgi:hypothetical protein